MDDGRMYKMAINKLPKIGIFMPLTPAAQRAVAAEVKWDADMMKLRLLVGDMPDADCDEITSRLRDLAAKRIEPHLITMLRLLGNIYDRYASGEFRGVSEAFVLITEWQKAGEYDTRYNLY